MGDKRTRALGEVFKAQKEISEKDKNLVLTEHLKREHMRKIREKFGINRPKKNQRRLELDKDI